MEFNELKETWRNTKTQVRSQEDMLSMLSENKHPVLRRIRKQLALEIAGWSAFLLCYYTMFDGHQKPVWVNILLIGTVLTPFIHNVTGYRFFKYVINGNDIRSSLENYLSRVRIYAVLSCMSRILFMAGLLAFFTYGINFTNNKYTALAVIALLFFFQLIVLYKVWSGRYRKLKEILSAFE